MEAFVYAPTSLAFAGDDPGMIDGWLDARWSNLCSYVSMRRLRAWRWIVQEMGPAGRAAQAVGRWRSQFPQTQLGVEFNSMPPPDILTLLARNGIGATLRVGDDGLTGMLQELEGLGRTGNVVSVRLMLGCEGLGAAEEYLRAMGAMKHVPVIDLAPTWVRVHGDRSKLCLQPEQMAEVEDVLASVWRAGIISVRRPFAGWIAEEARTTIDPPELFVDCATSAMGASEGMVAAGTHKLPQSKGEVRDAEWLSQQADALEVLGRSVEAVELKSVKQRLAAIVTNECRQYLDGAGASRQQRRVVLHVTRGRLMFREQDT
jgi:hypothetical protein